ncbi:hypothetical protein APHAL10511_002530 [Amanita phalloides]|nr:hypothetical protein APHAL10511_002530 [Amanita phalloides]
MINIEDSLVPFRALLGAILSVVKTVSVEPSEFSSDMELDTIVEEQDKGPLPEDDINDGSTYSPSSEEEVANDPPNTHNRHPTGQKAESDLMVSPRLLAPVICLACSLSDHLIFSKLTSILPSFDTSPPLREQCACLFSVRQEREPAPVADPSCMVWVDWKCRFDDSADLFITKIIDNGSITNLTSTLPWRRHSNLIDYTIVSHLAAMVHSKAMA